MRRLLMAALGAAFFVSPIEAMGLPGDALSAPKDINSYVNTVTISGDQGGYLADYAIRVNNLQNEGWSLRFDGFCGSACTLFLNVKGCVTPNAMFGFHQPTGGVKAKKWLMSQYPQWVRNWIKQQGGLTPKPIYMTYVEAAQHIPKCAT